MFARVSVACVTVSFHLINAAEKSALRFSAGIGAAARSIRLAAALRNSLSATFGRPVAAAAVALDQTALKSR